MTTLQPEEELAQLDDYEDTGCEVSPRCTRCPLRQCRHDNPRWFANYKRLARAKQIQRLRSYGIRPDAIAQVLDLGPRTVWRALRNQESLDTYVTEVN